MRYVLCLFCVVALGGCSAAVEDSLHATWKEIKAYSPGDTFYKASSLADHGWYKRDVSHPILRKNPPSNACTNGIIKQRYITVNGVRDTVAYADCPGAHLQADGQRIQARKP